MNRFETLLERYQHGEEAAGEAIELSRLVREDPDRAASFYDALMLEADLYETYSGIAQVQAVSHRRRLRLTPRVLAALAAAILMLAVLAALLRAGRPSAEKVRETAPVAPRPPELPPRKDPPPRREEEDEDDDDRGSKKEEIEREYRKGLRESERKRLEGKSAEADQKLREIEREREKQLRELKRREGDR